MLLAFHGLKGSGKDAAGERFARLTSLPSTQISFARKLKESYAALYDVPVEILEVWKNDETARVELWVGDEKVGGHTHRVGLQRKGTEGGRDIFGWDFWVDQAMQQYDTRIDGSWLFYITDCRFENEAQAIKDRGGYIVKVVGPPDESGDTHLSEVPLPDHLIDLVIDNTVRNDGFFNLDNELRRVANTFGFPVDPAVWA